MSDAQASTMTLYPDAKIEKTAGGGGPRDEDYSNYLTYTAKPII